MPDIWLDVDVALTNVPVNIVPLVDDTDNKTIEAAVVYNQAGLALFWHFITSAGVKTTTAVTPTTAGVYDWTDDGTSGTYSIEIPASGGASANNDTEGTGWFTGVATGILPWVGPRIGFRAAAINNALIDGGDNLDVNTVQVGGTTQTAGDVPALVVTADAAIDVAVADLANGTDGLGALKTLIDALPATTDIVSSGAITTLAGAVVNVDLVDTITTYTGNTLQTGDVTTAINDLANGTDGLGALKTLIDAVNNDLSNGTDGLGALKTIVDAIKVPTDKLVFTVANQLDVNTLQIESADATDTINAACDASIETYGLDHLVAVAVADEVVDDSIIAKMVDAGSTADWSSYAHTEDSQRAISENVNSIGSATGGGFKYPALSDDVLEDLIDNAGTAVDKGTTPATVGIPVTGAEAAGWLACDEATIALTTNYNGQFVIDSVSTNEIVIVATYSAETFGAADTIKRTIKATRLVGTEDSGTFVSTSAIDSVVHQIGDTANAFTISYRYDVGTSKIATEAIFTGYLNGGNDNGLLQAYNFVGSAWETRELLPGQAGTVNQTIVIPLLPRNTGISGIELGQVLLRIKDDGAGSSPTLNLDSMLVEAIGTGRAGAYQLGQIWIDTVNGFDGSTIDEHGTSTTPCKTFANVVALVAQGLPSDVHVLNGSAVVLDSTAENYSFFGDHWTLALGSQPCGGIYVQGATVSGVGTSSGEEMHFEGCDIGTATVEQGHFDKCGFTGTLTMNTADDYEFHNCYDKTATAAIFTKTASVNITAEWVNWSGSITLSGIQASSSYLLAGTELGDIVENGADGTVKIRGIYESNTDNRTGSPTLTLAAIKSSDIATTLVDTNELQTDLTNGGRLDLILDIIAADTTTDIPALIAALNDISTAQVNTEVDNAIVTYGLDHLVAASVSGADVTDDSIIAKLVSKESTADWDDFVNTTDSLQAIKDLGDAAWITGAGGTPPQLLQSTTIATLATQVSFTLTAGSADNDAYNGHLAIITDVATSTQKAVGVISDYVGSSKTITLDSDPAVFTMATTDLISIVAVNPASSAPTAAAIRIEIDSNSTQLAAIVADTNELQTDDIPGAIATLDAVVDTVKAETVLILADTADMQPRVVAVEVDTGTTLQAELDAIQAAVITNAAGVDIAADIIAMKAETALIVADTNELQTDDLPTLIGTVDTVVDGIQTDLSNGTDGLGALKTLLDTVNTDLSNGTDGLGALRTLLLDIPTVSEFETRTFTAAEIVYIARNASSALPVTFTTSGGSTTAAVLNLVDGSAGSAVDDQYNSRLLVFIDGTLKGVVTNITDYTGSTTTAVITAIPTAPTASHNAVLI